MATVLLWNGRPTLGAASLISSELAHWRKEQVDSTRLYTVSRLTSKKLELHWMSFQPLIIIPCEGNMEDCQDPYDKAIKTRAITNNNIVKSGTSKDAGHGEP
jgi:hypothetical protein